MSDGLMARLWAGLLATSPLEALAVFSGLVYVVLAVPRSRWCWVAGGLSSLIYVWLSARARLPMQSLLQVWYVGVAVYGFLRWSRVSWPPKRRRIGPIWMRRPRCSACSPAGSPHVPNSRAGYTGSSSIR